MARDFAPLAAASGSPEPPTVSGRARACVGFDDRVLHELEVGAGWESRSRIGRACRGELDQVGLDVVISDVGQPQQISAPRGGGYRPIRDLALTLNDLGRPRSP